MDLKLNGKRALVTGSTGGIGLAIAVALAKEGASVIVNGRTQQRVDAALKQVRAIAASAGEISGVAADLATVAGAEHMIRQAGDVDVLVNNLGIYGAKPFEQITDAEWDGIWHANIMSGVRLSRHYLPKMLKANWGRIMFISSESAIQTPMEMIHYGVTKTAQLALARGLAETTAGTGVTVNSILPGPTRSEGVEDFVGGMAKQKNVTPKQVEQDFFREIRPSSLLKRFIEPDEVAALVAFVASPLSSATNGAALRADGGVVRAIV
jgi:NAD(P)-dependent dehydrogenase (short-subunit alcohol dehydrogenase family)